MASRRGPWREAGRAPRHGDPGRPQAVSPDGRYVAGQRGCVTTRVTRTQGCRGCPGACSCPPSSPSPSPRPPDRAPCTCTTSVRGTRRGCPLGDLQRLPVARLLTRRQAAAGRARTEDRRVGAWPTAGSCLAAPSRRRSRRRRFALLASGPGGRSVLASRPDSRTTVVSDHPVGGGHGSPRITIPRLPGDSSNVLDKLIPTPNGANAELALSPTRGASSPNGARRPRMPPATTRDGTSPITVYDVRSGHLTWQDTFRAAYAPERLVVGDHGPPTAVYEEPGVG